MDPNVLREQLVKLHEELGLVSRVDPRSAQLLGEILEDIKRLTETPGTAAGAASAAAVPAAAAPPPAPSLPERLEEIAVRFEAQHPTLAASSRRLVDLLGKAGL